MRSPLGILAVIFVLALVAGVIYLITVGRRKEHCRDIAYTVMLSTLATTAILVPFFIPQHQFSSDSCAQFVGPACSSFVLPCELLFDKKRFPDDCVVIDRFLVWEAIAVIQTVLFGLLIFAEMKVYQVSRLTFVILLFIVGFPMASVAFMVFHQWIFQLSCNIGFLCAIFLEDLLFWIVERRREKAGQKAQVGYFARLTFGLDLPLILASLFATILVWGHFDDASQQGEYAKRFYAGATAFSLIVANIGLVANRFVMHRNHYHELHLTTKISVKTFVFGG